MKTTLPPKGMRDFLPREKEIREYVMNEIRGVYRSSGFEEIETSYIENVENLTGGDGGENTKLIFKILKRGEKLNWSDAKEEDDLTDLGLRFDLTLPLVRFYSNNKNELPTIFKAIQMGPVFRAERPGKGRFRAFTQCDIDIIGDESNLAEVEIILTIARALKQLDINHFKIKINDRRVLKALVTGAGFTEAEFPDIAITLDKLDKIGKEGIVKELEGKSYDKTRIEALMTASDALKEKGLASIESMCLDGYENLKEIIEVVEALKETYDIVFDHTLVRGMGYYTSTIFEIEHSDLGYSIAGGGRYDKMIGKMIGSEVPAVGFSIGFERIVDLLMAENKLKHKQTKIALIYKDGNALTSVMKMSADLREAYSAVSVYKAKKKLGKQIEQLKKYGYDGVAVMDGELEVNLFDQTV
ncbi:histidine--tRNA ligase [Fusibacter tunisiensis]|uniref:Histidine--tRNA ligase n=1 Tax=Fusibacter tunisiensis TaxID=1008308 RepID=A0ABS2MN61_9FIRM|nr:histidine--tRNA ligase [Fusibacter tunisiensis]MBM7560831.1 histidyl-tRNA synthetase [Fusibacter tunisiensis]